MEPFNILLNQFSKEQLNCILRMTDEKLEALQLQRMKAELREDEEEVSWLLKDIDKDLDTLTLFKIQVMNAQLDVKQIETTIWK